MGGEYPKGGGRYSWGIRPSGGWAIFLGISPPFERGANLLGGGGQKSCDNGMGKNLFCPPKI